MTKREQEIIKKWEYARTHWWQLTPAQLVELENEVSKICEKGEAK